MDNNIKCPYVSKCGGCSFIGEDYDKQLKNKRKTLAELFKGISVDQVIGMKDPFHYRNKVTCSFGLDAKKRPAFGIYEQYSHKLVPVEHCLIEDERADAIMHTLRDLFKSFKYKYYDEVSGYGLIRHVMIRAAHTTGQIMVILVLSSVVLPAKNNFIKALTKAHPEITTVILNVNERDTTFVLGPRNITLFGPGHIEDVLCGKRFILSPGSFYQVNSVQTEVLYQKAIKLAGLKGTETVIDAYCGIGTISLACAGSAKNVIGIELNQDAVADAIKNKKLNRISNVTFICGDAGEVMERMASEGNTADVVFMDPPRSGSSESFMDSVAVLHPAKVVYISCGPESLARDLEYFKTIGYRTKNITPVDMFPHTEHVECCCLLTRKEK